MPARRIAATSLTWLPVGLAQDRPVYQALADALAADIRAGRLRAGDRLPTQRALARALGLHVTTVGKAFAEAARRGLVEGTVGRGSFVRARAGDLPRALRAPDGAPLIDFNFNLPAADPGLLDAGPVLAALGADGTRAPLATGYVPRGLPEHRAAGVRWLARSRATVHVDRVLVCGGAQQAMALALSNLVAPGDVVLADEVTYPGLATLVGLLRARLIGVTGDARGMLPEALAEAALANRARVVFTLPNVHNPTGLVWDEARRAEIVAVARRHGLQIVEDDSYGFLLGAPPPPLAALAPERTWFVASTAKALTPGLRIGYLAVPDQGAASAALLERVSETVAALGWMAAPLMAEIATRWIEDGTADAVVAAKRREIAARRELFDRLCGAGASASHAASGHLWLTLRPPWRGAALAARARDEGLALAPAEVFVTERARVPQAVRVCIGTPPTRSQCEQGLEILARVLQGAPAGLA